MGSVEIKSCYDSTALTLTALGDDFGELAFSAELSGAPFNGLVRSSTWHNGPPTLLFQELARDWQGWNGKKEWAALEGELRLTATCDSGGHIALTVHLSQQSGDFTASATIWLEAGQLDQVFQRVNAVLPTERR
ncbi:DUF6228 family protein [Lysobacter yangpyeongensis]|uniref:DUF6228 family protein n=1 Tax=Lysobacter yangpyeongensis TaxID=346182 RepID=A0ABW0SS85_9GAMM